MNGRRFIDPDVRRILEEVAGEAGAQVVARTERDRARPQHRARVLQRSLDEVHRYEISLLLRDASILTILRDPHWRFSIDRSLRAQREVTWRRKARAETRRERAQRLFPAEISLLKKCLRGRFRRGPTVDELVRATMRLVPSGWTYLHSALDDLKHGNLDSAERTLRALASEEQFERGLRVATWQWLAQVYVRRGELVRVVQAYRRATESTDHGQYSAVHWLFFAVQIGDVESAQTAARTLDSLAEATDPAVDVAIKGLEGTREHHVWSPSKISLSTLHAVECLGSASQRVLDTFKTLVMAGDESSTNFCGGGDVGSRRSSERNPWI